MRNRYGDVKTRIGGVAVGNNNSSEAEGRVELNSFLFATAIYF